MGGILFLSVPLFYIFVLAKPADSSERMNDLTRKIATLSVLAVILGSWLQVVLQAVSLESLNLLPRLIYATHTGALLLSRQALVLPALFLLNGHKRWLVVTAAIYEACILSLCFVSGMQGEAAAHSALIIAGVIIAWGWYKRSGGNQKWNSFLILGLINLLYFSLGSHAGAVSGSFWAILSDYIHLIATSSWVGGLMLLPLALGAIHGRSPAPDRDMLGPIFRRYGYMAKFSFFLLLTTGLFNSLIQFPTFASIINTSYGRVLLIKWFLALAVWALSITSAHLLRGKMEPSQFAKNFERFFQRVGQAAIIGAVLMLAVAILVQTQPPKSTSQEVDTSYNNIVYADDLSIHFQITPNQPGDNQFNIHLFHADGSPIRDVQLVRLLFNYEDAQVGQANADLTQLGAGLFGIEGVYLNQPGAWTVSVYVRRRGLDDVLTDLRVSVPDPAGVNLKAGPFQSPVSTVPVNGILSGGLIILSVEMFRWREIIKKMKPGLFNIVFLTACISLVIGAYLALAIFTSN